MPSNSDADIFCRICESNNTIANERKSIHCRQCGYYTTASGTVTRTPDHPQWERLGELIYAEDYDIHLLKGKRPRHQRRHPR